MEAMLRAKMLDFLNDGISGNGIEKANVEKKYIYREFQMKFDTKDVSRFVFV